MKNSFTFVFIFFLTLSVHAVKIQSTKAVAVEIDLEEIPNTGSYEIEVKKIGKKESVKSFSQDGPDFRIKLDVGNYLVRTRVVARSSQIGPWSDWTELLARPEEVHLIDPPSYNINVNKKQSSADIEIKWEKSNGADQYLVWNEDLKTKKIIKKTSSSDGTKLNLRVGEYRVGVQSVSKDGIKSEVKYFDNIFNVAYSRLPIITILRPDRESFSWQIQKESAVKIDIYRKPFFGDKFIRIDTLKEAGELWRVPKNLEPGEYRFEFQYVSDAFVNGPVATINFVKKPTESNFQIQ